MTYRPDLILTCANVITIQSVRPFAEAIAIGDGRILAVGDSPDIERMRVAHTEVLDCKGRTVIPGVVDPHIHFLSYAASLLSVDCSPEAAPDLAAIQAAVRDRAAGLPDGAWIRATGYDESTLGGRHPTRHDLDLAAPRHPVRLIHRSGHAVVLNTLALRLAAITNETEEPSGAYIERDLETGLPTGLLFEMNHIIDRVVPPLNEADLTSAARQASQRLLGEGVTAFQDATHTNGADEFALFRRLVSQGYILQHVSVMEGYDSFAGPGTESLPALVGESLNARGSPLSPVKIMLHELGDSVWPAPDDLTEMVARVHAAGRQVAIHAVGKQAVQLSANAIGSALVSRPVIDHRHRIEHCSVCPPELAAQLGHLGVVVVSQPSFLYYNGDRYTRDVVEEGQPNLYPFRRLSDAGLTVAASSDAPVVRPKLGPRLSGVVTRRGNRGVVLNPDERLDIIESLRMATVNAAFAARTEHSWGKIAPGRAADLVVLSENLLQADERTLASVQVAQVVLGGQLVELA